MAAGADDAWCGELIDDFVTESLEHLSTVESDLLLLEAGEDTEDGAVVNQVFRSVHSVKGGAGFLGLQTINVLAHRLESVLDRIRDGELAPAEEIVDALLKGTDRLRELVSDVANSNDADIDKHLTALEPFMVGDADSDEEQDLDAASSVDASVDDAPPDDEPSRSADEAPDSPPVETRDEASDSVSPTPTAAVPASPADSKSKPASTSSNQRGAAQKQATSIRVSTEVLDRLMNLSGELVLGRNQLVQVLATDATESRDRVVGHLNQVVSDLQETVMRTRMQPIETVLNRFPRLVRDLSQRVGKECALVVFGRDVDVDRTILESLGDPLTHLVRNAIDHGLEGPEERVAAGKKPCGSIELVASHLGSNVLIEIADDGRGIDPEVIRRKAVEKGVLSADEAASLSENEAIELIFHPGFSTKEEITDLSGRGVGMDVVRSNIESLGGSIQISSTLGEGTTFTITIPLTLAIMHGLVLSCEDRRYVLPQLNVIELVRVKTEDLESRVVAVKGRQVLRLRGELLPVVDIHDAIGNTDRMPGAATRSRNFLIVETGKVRYGISVESSLDTEEIVVKPLGRHLDRLPQYSGATILGDGTVAMILDVSGIATRMDIRAVEASDHSLEENEGRHAADRLSIVVFRNREDESFAVPLCQLARIYRIQNTEISTLGRVLVHQQDENALPLIALHDWIDAAPIELPTHLCVLVLKTGSSSEVGVLAPHLDDIQELDVQVDDSTLRGPGVLGSFQLEGNTVRLLAIQELIGLALPHLGGGTAQDGELVDSYVDEEAQPAGRRILYAEDSAFFRRNFSQSLQRYGYEVTLAEDGQEAWEILVEHGPEAFDAVVTDIEMPRCTGFELSRRIREDERFDDLFIVAMTSLSTDRDRATAAEAGMDAHLIKLDENEFQATLERLLANPRRGHAHV